MNALPTDIALNPFINGRHVAPSATDTVPTFDPATGTVLAQIPVANADTVHQAVQAATTALRGAWSAVLPAERGRILYRTAQGIRQRAETLAVVESLDSGKPLREAKVDIETAARYFEYYAGMADKLQGDTIPLGPDFTSMTVHQAIGVTAHIIPWNFPLVTTARGLAPCLAAGATAVIKPAEETPLTALMLCQILQEAGVPDGAANVVCGPGEVTGAALVAHPDIAHVTFTGSTETGKIVMKAAADHTAAVTLELGGKSPLVVMADADLDAALQGVLKAIFTNAGQVCSAGSRLIVERPIAHAFIARLLDATRTLTVGKGLQNPDIGPVISPVQLRRIAGMVKDAADRGMSVLTGGEILTPAGLEQGNFYAPTLMLADDANDAIVQEEIFGPVLAIQTADDLEHAIELANGTRFGLVAGIYTRNISTANRFAQAVQAGQVFINQYFAGGVETPFGGTKASGFGREKGLEGLRAYLQVKTITTRI